MTVLTAFVAVPVTATHASAGGTITYESTIGGQQGEAVVYPSGVAVDAAGNVYVADTGNYQIEKWAQGTGSPTPPVWSEGVRGAPSMVGGETSFQAPRDVAVDPVPVNGTQRVYVADTDDSTVQVLDASTGAYLQTVTAFGGGQRFSDPIGISVGTDSLGNEIILVSDGHTGNVYVFDMSFTLQRTIPPTVAAEGTRDAATDSAGNIYTADYRGGKIDVYTPQNTSGIPDLSWGIRQSKDCHDVSHPYGVDIDTNDTPNRVYVASSDLEQVKVFDTSGNCLDVGTTNSNAIGTKTTTSTDNSKLFQLRRVAVGAGANPLIYAADLWGLKVLTYNSSDGTISGAQPEIGDGQYPQPGNLNEPHSLAIDAADGRIFVTNTVNQRVESFDFNGNNPQAWGVKGTLESTTSFNWAQGIAYNAFNGTVWVANTRNNRIDEFTPDGKTKLGSFPPVTRLSSVFYWPMAVAFGPTLSSTGSSTDSTMYVADTYHSQLKAYAVSGTTVNPTALWTTPSRALVKPFSLAYDTTQSSPRLLVADTFHNRVVSLDPATGALVKVLINFAGSQPGYLSRPEGVTVDPTGNIWVADTGNNRVEEFNADGNYTGATFGSYGTVADGDNVFNAPQGIGFDPQGLLYVADVNNNRIQVFTVS